MSSLYQFQKMRIGVLWATAAMALLFVFFVGSAWEEKRVLGIDMDVSVQAVGLLLLLVAIVGRVWCSLYIGGRKNRKLVQMGPYSTCRNPLYAFSIVGAVGIGAQTGSLIVAALCGLIAWLVFLPTARREEAELERLFGPTFVRYRDSVPFLMPAFRLYRAPKQEVFEPGRVTTTFRDALFFLLAIPVTNGIELLQANDWIGVAVWLY